MVKDLVQKTFDFMNEPEKKETKKIKATLFQKIILGAMISVPIVVPSYAYLINKEVERMNRGVEGLYELGNELKERAINAGIGIFQELIIDPPELTTDSQKYEDKKESYPDKNKDSY